MSEDASDLLVYGIAAAKAHEKDEARFYLEWVLRSDPDLEQEADSWYWLSQITDEPGEKRQCLENVLAAAPNYPEARRDLAIIDGRLDPKDVYSDPCSPPPTLHAPDTVATDEIRRFQCPKCGARTAYDPKLGVVACQFCGYQAGQPAAAGGATSAGGDKEQDWIAAMYTKKGHEWVLPTERVMTCQGCGALFSLPASVVSAACPYCGAASVILTRVAEGLIQPEGIAPFKVDAVEAAKRARDWLGSRSFSPSGLEELSTLVPPRPLYVPFWTFDISAEVTWRGYSSKSELGDQSRVGTGGVAPVLFDDVRIPGSKSGAEPHVAALSFDTKSLLPYSPDLLASWPAEIYTVSLADASVRAHEYAHNMAEPRFRAEMAGMLSLASESKVENVEVSLETYRLVLLPVWTSNYSFEGVTHALAISGQTGDVRGDVPRSGIKKLLGELLSDD